MNSVHQNLDQVTVVNESLYSLTEGHQKQIAARGLDPLWAGASCQSVDAKRAEDFLGYPAKSPGIMLIGEGYQFQYRPDVPWASEDGKKPKYRTPAGEYDAWLAKHPTDKDYWTVDRLKQNCYQINGHPYILITEGGFKAVGGCSNDLPTIALMGVTMGLTPKKADPDGRKYLVETLKKYAEAKFGFIIAFDADAKTNKNVRDAERDLTNELLTAGCPVLSITGSWNVADGKGMDDYIQNKGIEAFRAVLMKAVNSHESRDTEDGRTPTKTKKPPTPREMAARLAEQYSHQWQFDNEQKCWRVWTGKHWEKAEIGAFKSLVKTTIDARNVNYSGIEYINNTVELLQCDLRQIHWQTWDRKQFINFSNCVLDGNSGEPLEHLPGMGFTSHLPYEFQPLTGEEEDPLKALRLNCVHTYNWMFSAMKGDSKKVLKLLSIISGVLKFRFHDLQMFVHLIGKPGTGKGTFVRLLQKIVGKDNYTGCSLKRLDDSSTMAGVLDKQLATFPDERTPVGIDHILNLTGGDAISFRRLYQDAASAPFYGAIVIASNDPIFVGNTTGLERRLCLVEFDNPLRAYERNSGVEAQMESEIPQLIAIALSLPDQQVRDMIQGEGAGSIGEFKMAEWAMRCDSSSLVGFFDEQIVIEEGATTATGKLYDKYKQYCEDTGRKAICLNKFSNQLNDLLEEFEVDARLHKARNKSNFINLRLRSDNEDTFTHGEKLAEQMLGLLGQCEGNVTTSVRAKTLMGEELEQMLGQNGQNFSETSNPTLQAKPDDGGEGESEGKNIGENVLTDLALTKPQVPHQQGSQPSQQPSHSPNICPNSPNISAEPVEYLEPKRLAEEVRQALAAQDKTTAKQLAKAIKVDKVLIEQVKTELTTEEADNFKSLARTGLMKGMRVRCVGDKYAGEYGELALVVEQIDYCKVSGRPEITCLMPDGRFTTRLFIESLKRV